MMSYRPWSDRVVGAMATFSRQQLQPSVAVVLVAKRSEKGVEYSQNHGVVEGYEH